MLRVSLRGGVNKYIGTGAKMLVIGAFEHSTGLEQALAVLEAGGIDRRRMMVVVMDGTLAVPNAPDRFSKGVEIGLAVATALSVVGTSVGFVLPLGPIFSGLLFALTGFIVSFGLYLLIKKPGSPPRTKAPEVTVVVECSADESALVINTMLQYGVLAVGSARR
jgi:hypothetical protein